ncbi:MAG: hypothetical protein ACI89R_001436, partial [Candidatus Azotimanducaceae bacterium]
TYTEEVIITKINKTFKMMRTLNINQISSTLKNSRLYSWNSKRRHR